MARQTTSWSRETARLFLQYLAVGLSFIPAALLYALFAATGRDSTFMGLVCLGFGFLCAHWVWNRLARQGRGELEQRFAAGYLANAELDRRISQEFAYVDSENF